MIIKKENTIIVPEIEKHRTFYDMSFKEILTLEKKYKVQAIQILIESMIKDNEQKVIAFYEEEWEALKNNQSKT